MTGSATKYWCLREHRQAAAPETQQRGPDMPRKPRAKGAKKKRAPRPPLQPANLSRPCFPAPHSYSKRLLWQRPRGPAGGWQLGFSPQAASCKLPQAVAAGRRYLLASGFKRLLKHFCLLSSQRRVGPPSSWPARQAQRLAGGKAATRRVRSKSAGLNCYRWY
jgi:hypothetical protein